MITDKNNIIANDNILVARHRTRTMNNTLVILKWTDDKTNILVRMFLSMIFLQESFFVTCDLRRKIFLNISREINGKVVRLLYTIPVMRITMDTN